MVKAIIFDCFGVLVGSSLEPFIEKYLAHDQALVDKANAINHQACLGSVTYDEQIEQFSVLAGLPLEETRKMMNLNPPNTMLLEYIANELKGRYKIGFLSNASDDWTREFFTPEQMELFDDVILSYVVNIAKPDPAIYELAARRLNVELEECIFVDDRADYCDGAKKVGMRTILYVGFKNFKQQVTGLLNE